MPSRSCINPVVVRHVLAELSLCGVNTSMLCRGIGVSGEVLHDPQFFLSSRQASLLLRRALKSFQYPGMGNVIGQRRTIVSSGLIGLGILASANLREALDLVARHPWALGTLLDVHLSPTPQGGLAILPSVNEEVDPFIEGFLVDELFASMSAICRAFAGPDARAESVSLRYNEPSHAGQIRDFFRCSLCFGRPAHAFVLGKEALDVHNEAADPFVVQSVRHELARIDDGNSLSDLCGTVRRILMSSMPNIPTLPDIGKMLHASERTLRRRFGEDNTNYQKLIDEVRKEKAIALLTSSSLSIDAVAAEVGFADVRNFRRAFHRWTGRAPTALRKQAA